MASSQAIDVVDIVDNQRFRAFNLNVVAWCFLIMLSDGFDITVIAFAMPSIAKEWNITNLALLGPVFSASLLGVLIGSPLFGNIADRIGRKKTIILCTLFFGFSAWATTLAQTITQLMVLRFVCGIGMGGVIPLGIVTSAEFAPKRMRAAMMTMATTGVTIGAGLPGLAATWLLSHYGWHGLFWLGGLVPIGIALIAIFALPESPKFLAMRQDRKVELADLLMRMRPGLILDPAVDRMVFNEEQKEAPSVRDLFAGRFLYTTTLLWLMFIIVGAVLYFIQAWTPTIFTQAGRPLGEVAIALAMFQAGGAIGGALMGFPVDRFGITPMTITFVISIPIVALIGLPGMSNIYLMMVLTVAGFLTLGLQLGLNAIAGLMYPTFNRANGVGWGLGNTRIGQMIGAMVGGYLLHLGVSIQILFYLLAALLVFGAFASFALGRMFVRNEG
jgi:AAHS family 4-hydroxybenzoate transporter-like MFS transporter